MSSESPSTDHLLPWERTRTTKERPPIFHLVLAWSLDEPERLGEAIPVAGPVCVGRGAALSDDPSPRAVPVRMRPGATDLCGPIACSRIARLQLLLNPKSSEVLEVESVGKAQARINGRHVTKGELRVGDVLEIHNAAVYFVTLRPPTFSGQSEDERDFP